MADLPMLDDIAARALCSIILERTADTLRDGGRHAEDALKSFAVDSGLMLDVAAAVLMATSWLAGTGGITDEAVFAASVAFQPDDEETAASVVDNAPGIDPGATAVPGAGEADELDNEAFAKQAQEATAAALAAINGDGGTDDT